MTRDASAPVLNLDGYTDLPSGKIATVVTFLEIRAAPARRPVPRRELQLLPLGDDVARYRALYRSVGEPWLWFSRLFMPEAALRALLSHPRVEAFALREGESDIGLLELDFRSDGECELAYFGLVPEVIGTGAGRFLMDAALERAFARGVRRLWVHTCTLDHPSAIGFYIRSGFTPYKRALEVADDPRLSGHIPRDVMPDVPVIG